MPSHNWNTKQKLKLCKTCRSRQRAWLPQTIANQYWLESNLALIKFSHIVTFLLLPDLSSCEHLHICTIVTAIRHKESNWAKFLKQDLKGAVCAPAHLFHRVGNQPKPAPPLPTTPFRDSAAFFVKVIFLPMVT